jgi:F0F1-type ATP synthase membrane subunit b/b'
MSSNGSNARLDRIEKLIEESERANKEAHARHEKAHARHDREIAESRAEFKQEMAEHRRQMNTDLRKTREYMRRWAALSVQEARNQRNRHLKLDADIGRLVSSHLETEALVKGFIASLKAGGNGGPKAS